MTYAEYCALQEKRKTKGDQPQIVVAQDTKGNIVVTITLPPPERSGLFFCATIGA